LEYFENNFTAEYSDKIVMWRFLRNRRLLLYLHTIFRALIYWAHRAVVLAIAWHLVITGHWHNKQRRLCCSQVRRRRRRRKRDDASVWLVGVVGTTKSQQV